MAGTLQSRCTLGMSCSPTLPFLSLSHIASQAFKHAEIVVMQAKADVEI